MLVPGHLPTILPTVRGGLTSMGAQEGVVGDRPWLCEGVELIEPFSGHVEPEQAGLPHGSQGHHLLPLTHGLLTALPGVGGGGISMSLDSGCAGAPGGQNHRATL